MFLQLTVFLFLCEGGMSDGKTRFPSLLPTQGRMLGFAGAGAGGEAVEGQ